jgi:uncharacterized membrane protein
MRTGLLFTHILCAAVLVGGLIFRIVFVPLSRKLKSDSEAKTAIYLQARVFHSINPVVALLLLSTGYFLAQNFGGIASQRWLWVSLLLTVFSSALIAVAGNQEERLSERPRSEAWSRFFKIWSAEMVLSTTSVFIVLYLMVVKSF